MKLRSQRRVGIVDLELGVCRDAFYALSYLSRVESRTRKKRGDFVNLRKQQYHQHVWVLFRKEHFSDLILDSFRFLVGMRVYEV